MDLSSQWILAATLLSLIGALFHYSFYTLLRVATFSVTKRIVVFVAFLLIRYGWPLTFTGYLVLYTKCDEDSVKYLSFQGGILFCAVAVDLLYYGYRKAKKRDRSILHLQQRLKTIETRINTFHSLNT